MRRQPLVSAAPGRKRASRSGCTSASIARGRLRPMHPFDVDKTRKALAERGGGYEVVHSSPGLEIGVYVLVAPEPDRQQPHEFDEVYIVLEGSGVLEVEGVATPLQEGGALFV